MGALLAAGKLLVGGGGDGAAWITTPLSHIANIIHTFTQPGCTSPEPRLLLLLDSHIIHTCVKGGSSPKPRLLLIYSHITHTYVQGGSSPEASLLLMDNVAAFYYQDRAVRAAAAWGVATAPPLATAVALVVVGAAGKLGGQQGGGTPTPASPPLPLPTLHRVHAAIAMLLRRLCTESRCGCVCSKYTAGVGGGGGGTGGTGGTGGAGEAAAAGKEFMPAQWQAVVTHRCAQ